MAREIGLNWEIGVYIVAAVVVTTYLHTDLIWRNTA
jgi:hypothetical protein